jgi:Amt family ammonium transporter
MSAADTAWLLMSSALVLFMTPGLAFFYGGLVRGRNVISTVMLSFMSMAVVSVVWVLWGFSLAFSGDGPLLGNLALVGLKGMAPDEQMLFAIFQMMFAIITPALITGAVVERFRFTTYLVFLVAWVTLVYAPVAHWVWAPGGWLYEMGVLDFAGGTVVHINAAAAALVAAYLVRKRRNPGVEPSNVPYVVLGTGILWFGWFGFNAGSGLRADGSAINAFMVTNTSGATAALTWGLLSQFQHKRMSAAGVATGAVAGLASITPAAGSVGVMGAMVVGMVAGGLCYGAVLLRPRFKLDDSLDVFAVHGVGSIWGMLAAGIFTVGAFVGAEKGGLIEGNIAQLGTQAIGIVVTLAYSLVASFIILKVLDVIPGLGLRVSERDEDMGLDIAAHGERAVVHDGAD